MGCALKFSILVLFIGGAHFQKLRCKDEDEPDTSPYPCVEEPLPGIYPYDVHTHCDPWGGGANCGDFQYVRMTYVEYGRRDDIYWDWWVNPPGPVCAFPGPVIVGVCTHPQALQIMKNQCDGLSYCGIGHTTYQLNSPGYFFPDPCPGSQNSLFTKWECCDRVCSDTTSLLVCEKQPQKIKCKGGYEIKIVSGSVFYGRENTWTCAAGPMSQIPCNFANAEQTIRLLCDGQQSCTVQATASPLWFWPDPCPGTSKYLKLDYKCCQKTRTPGCSSTFEKTMCEGDSLTLTCKAGWELYIHDYARWGRWDYNSCTGGAIQTTSCGYSWTTIVLRSQCNRKNTCTINANPAFFAWNGASGDPCPGTFKQLRFKYRCCQIPN